MDVVMEDSYSLLWEMKWAHKRKNINSNCTLVNRAKHIRECYGLTDIEQVHITEQNISQTFCETYVSPKDKLISGC